MLAKTNKAQRDSIYRKWSQNDQGHDVPRIPQDSTTGFRLFDGAMVWNVARHRDRWIHSQLKGA
jgi:hypothetical protein